MTILVLPHTSCRPSQLKYYHLQRGLNSFHHFIITSHVFQISLSYLYFLPRVPDYLFSMMITSRVIADPKKHTLITSQVFQSGISGLLEVLTLSLIWMYSSS